MTKSLEQIQQENRKFILEAIYGCSYEEALKKELRFGCIVIDKKHQFFGELSPLEMTLVYGNEIDGEESDPLYFLHLRGNPCVSFSKQVIFDKDRFEIIGKPLTLSRVLLASIKSAKCMDCFERINNKYCSSEWHVDREENLSRIKNFILDNWKNLELETLEEQTEETQRGINKFFNN